ncbi:MAG: YHYH protein, partial [Planctomycetia bacterium]|nr:YHYH protein [Planctomycetia bacterium]
TAATSNVQLIAGTFGGVPYAGSAVTGNATRNSLTMENGANLTIADGAQFNLRTGGILVRAGAASTISGGVLYFPNTFSPLTIWTVGNLTISSSLAGGNGIASGNMSLIKNGLGTLTIAPVASTINGLAATGTNSLSGQFVLNQGTLKLGAGINNAIQPYNYFSAMSGTLDLNGTSLQTYGFFNDSGVPGNGSNITSTNGTGPVKRMASGYRLRNITNRQTLANGTVLTPAQYGPAIAAPYVLGYFIEDYEYVAGLGDLDESNGRFAVTPEYPQGIYAYYTTVDAAGAPIYPYHIGPKYYGVVANDNITSRGHVTIAEPVTTYVPTLGVDSPPTDGVTVALAQNQPNPAVARASIRFTLA